MAVYKRQHKDKNGTTVKAKVYAYDFMFNGERYKGSTECTGKTRAQAYENTLRKQLERALSGLPTEEPEVRVRTVTIALRDYEEHYAVDHAPKSVALVQERSAHLRRLLGTQIAAQLTEGRMQRYRKDRLAEDAGTRTIDMELEVLSRAFGSKWSVWWPKLKRLDKGSEKGQVIRPVDEQRILDAAKKSRSPYLHTYLAIAFTTGMRSGEVRLLRWDRFVLSKSHEESYVRVGKSKTEGGKDRAIPMDRRLWDVMLGYRSWYESKLGKIHPSSFVFPFAVGRKPVDPTRPATTIKSAWQALKKDLGIDYRLHDTRHTVATALAEANVPEAKRRYLMGHVDEKVIRRYTHLEAEHCREDLQRALASRHSPQGVVPSNSPSIAKKRKRDSA